MSRYHELPWPPPKRPAGIVSQFSECLLFTEQQTGTLSRWETEFQLKQHMQKLTPEFPNYHSVDWLVYFVDRVTHDNYSVTERQQALRHLWCFYQLEFYYLARRWWFKLKSAQGALCWTELFDVISSPFTDLNRAARSLKNFDPHSSSKSYINTTCYRVGKDWLKKRLKADFDENPIILQSLEVSQGEDEARSRSQQSKIEEVTTEEQETSDVRAKQKVEQERIWQLLNDLLAELRQQSQTGQLAYFQPSKLTLWEVMLIGYGLNIGQSGTALILENNQQDVDQSKISRRLKTFKMSLFARCVEAFAREIAEEFSDGLPASETQPDFQKIAQQQHKSFDPLLKNYYQEWIYDRVLCTQDFTSELKAIYTGILYCLQLWFQSELELSFEMDYLTAGMIKKLQQVLMIWSQQLVQERE